jgi:hypothetical protein
LSTRLTEKQKKEIKIDFSSGKTLDELSKKFNCSKLTITRNLKKALGDLKYKKLIKDNNSSKLKVKEDKKNDDFEVDENSNYSSNKEKIVSKKLSNEVSIDQFNNLKHFVEIAPLDCEIDNATQKDLSSIPLLDIDFPKIVYMIVDKKIELEIKYLKDFPEYQFLSQNELARKTIQIYNDPKLAKRVCNGEQRVIKVPNTDVFRIVAPILRSRGISRIVTEDKLIAL